MTKFNFADHPSATEKKLMNDSTISLRSRLFSWRRLFDAQMTDSPCVSLTTKLVLAILFCVSISICTTQSAAQDSGEAPNESELLTFEMKRVFGDATWNRFAESDEGQTFLKTLTDDETWKRELLDSGPVKNGDRIAEFLFRVWKTDKTVNTRPIDRSMLTACALEMGMSDFDPAWTHDRFRYFQSGWNQGLLNSCYGELKTWERRFLAHGPQYRDLVDAEEMAYLRDLISWPRTEYVHACWQAPYRGHNCFGDSVQGRLYYEPFQQLGYLKTERNIKIGGVCGALSNTGAAASIANGVPAITMGEPGHCAYAVQTAPGIWTPAYSLSWKRGLHFEFFRNTWPSLILTQKCFEDEKALRNSNHFRRLAHWHEANGNLAKAGVAFGKGLKEHSLNFELWLEAIENCKKRNISIASWRSLHKMLVSTLGTEHEEPAWFLLSQHIYPQLLENVSAEERAELFLEYLAHIDEWGGGRWNIEGALNWMADRVGNEVVIDEFITETMQELMKSPAVAGAFVGWVSNRYQTTPEKWNTFLKFVGKNVSGRKEDQAKILSAIVRTGLPSAAERGDNEQFQLLGKLTRRLDLPSLPSLKDAGIEPFPGKLLSSGGSLKVQAAGNRYDNPLSHWGVLEKQGGSCHTSGAEPWIEVRLKDFGELSGIVLMDSKSNSYSSRSGNARILVSVDGKEWKEVAKTDGGSKQWRRIDLSELQPRAGWIRIEGAHDCLHFSRICVFGKKIN